MSGTSRAQTPEALAKVRDLNKKAVEAYENLDLEEARKNLMQALELCATEGLNRHTLKAQTHVNLAVVLVGGLKQRDAAIKQFQRALEIDPAIRVPKRLSNPEIQSAFDSAFKEMGSVGPTPATPPPEAPPVAAQPPAETPAAGPPPADAISHKAVTAGRAGEALAVTARVASGFAFDRLVLAYRPEGATDFLARDMEKDESGDYVARIPEPATHGGAVAYYVEARARNGQALATSGTADDPHVVHLTGDGSAPVAGEVESAPERPGADRGPTGPAKFWLSMGIGVGGGWAKGRPEVNRNYQDAMHQVHDIQWAAVAPARLMHFVPEVGFFLNQNLLLSVQGRLQVTTGATKVIHVSCQPTGTCEPASGAIAVLGKGTYIMRAKETFRPYVSLAAGGGYIRYLVDLKNRPLPADCGPNKNETCKDTVAGGGFLVGPGAGFIYDLNKAISLTAALSSLIGLKATAYNLDLNLGLAYRL